MLTERRRYLGLHRQFLDPGHPGAVDHNVAVILDCLSKYNIDGINLDYIRYPELRIPGYNPVSVARFQHVHRHVPTADDHGPQWCDWRRECVTHEVKKIYVQMWKTQTRRDPDRRHHQLGQRATTTT